MDKFKFKIKELRLSRNISQQQLANDLNVSKQAVSKWEKGHSLPDIASVEMIAAYFGVSTDYLLNDGIDASTNRTNNLSNNVEIERNRSYDASAAYSGRGGYSELTKKKMWILLSAVCFLLVVVIVLSICLGVSESKRKSASYAPTKVSLNGLEVTYMSYEEDSEKMTVFLYIQNVSDKYIEFSPLTAFAIDRQDCNLSCNNFPILLEAREGCRYAVEITPIRYAKGYVTLYCFGSPIAKCKFKFHILI